MKKRCWNFGAWTLELFVCGLFLSGLPGCATSEDFGKMIFYGAGDAHYVAGEFLELAQNMAANAANDEDGDVRELAPVLGFGAMLLEKSGLKEAESFEVKSSRISGDGADGSDTYLNEYKLFFGDRKLRGLFPALLGRRSCDWSEEIAGLSRNTLSFAEFELDATGFYAALLREISDPAILENACIAAFGVSGVQLAAQLTGRWRFHLYLSNEPDDGSGAARQLSWRISVPDPDGTVFNGLVKLDKHTDWLGDELLLWNSGGRLILASSTVPEPAGDGAPERLKLPQPLNGAGVWYAGGGAPDALTAPGEIMLGREGWMSLLLYIRWCLQPLEQQEIGVLAVGECAVTVKKYSTRSIPEEAAVRGLFWPGTFAAGGFIDAWERISTRARQLENDRGCEQSLSGLYRQLRRYAAEHGGKFSRLDGAGGLAEMRVNTGDFYYLGGGAADSVPPRPVLLDTGPWHGVGKKYFNALFSDGEIRRFYYDNPAPRCKHLVSVMRTKCEFPETVFADLIRRAETLDGTGR